MAKELPYFKFEPDQWENGTIQMCSKAQKGLFIDLCSVYWSRLGELPYALALQKHCNGDASELQALIDNDIIGLVNNQIIIEFLDEQLDEFQKTSDKRRDAANKRWNKDANALQLQSKSNAIREEKRREEKRINIEFDLFWDLYEKKVNRVKSEKKWLSLKDKEREAIIDFIPRYKKNQPDPQFRKDPMTFLNNRSWEDEIIGESKKEVGANFNDKALYQTYCQ
jgi:hypothetical protein